MQRSLPEIIKRLREYILINRTNTKRYLIIQSVTVIPVDPGMILYISVPLKLHCEVAGLFFLFDFLFFSIFIQVTLSETENLCN